MESAPRRYMSVEYTDQIKKSAAILSTKAGEYEFKIGREDNIIVRDNPMEDGYELITLLRRESPGPFKKIFLAEDVNMFDIDIYSYFDHKDVSIHGANMLKWAIKEISTINHRRARKVHDVFRRLTDGNAGLFLETELSRSVLEKSGLALKNYGDEFLDDLFKRLEEWKALHAPGISYSNPESSTRGDIADDLDHEKRHGPGWRSAGRPGSAQADLTDLQQKSSPEEKVQAAIAPSTESPIRVQASQAAEPLLAPKIDIPAEHRKTSVGSQESFRVISDGSAQSYASHLAPADTSIHGPQFQGDVSHNTQNGVRRYSHTASSGGRGNSGSRNQQFKRSKTHNLGNIDLHRGNGIGSRDISNPNTPMFVPGSAAMMQYHHGIQPNMPPQLMLSHGMFPAHPQIAPTGFMQQALAPTGMFISGAVFPKGMPPQGMSPVPAMGPMPGFTNGHMDSNPPLQGLFQPLVAGPPTAFGPENSAAPGPASSLIDQRRLSMPAPGGIIPNQMAGRDHGTAPRAHPRKVQTDDARFLAPMPSREESFRQPRRESTSARSNENLHYGFGGRQRRNSYLQEKGRHRPQFTTNNQIEGSSPAAQEPGYVGYREPRLEPYNPRMEPTLNKDIQAQQLFHANRPGNYATFETQTGQPTAGASASFSLGLTGNSSYRNPQRLAHTDKGGKFSRNRGPWADYLDLHKLYICAVSIEDDLLNKRIRENIGFVTMSGPFMHRDICKPQTHQKSQYFIEFKDRECAARALEDFRGARLGIASGIIGDANFDPCYAFMSEVDWSKSGDGVDGARFVKKPFGNLGRRSSQLCSYQSQSYGRETGRDFGPSLGLHLVLEGESPTKVPSTPLGKKKGKKASGSGHDTPTRQESQGSPSNKQRRNSTAQPKKNSLVHRQSAVSVSQGTKDDGNGDHLTTNNVEGSVRESYIDHSNVSNGSPQKKHRSRPASASSSSILTDSQQQREANTSQHAETFSDSARETRDENDLVEVQSTPPPKNEHCVGRPVTHNSTSDQSKEHKPVPGSVSTSTSPNNPHPEINLSWKRLSPSNEIEGTKSPLLAPGGRRAVSASLVTTALALPTDNQQTVPDPLKGPFPTLAEASKMRNTRAESRISQTLHSRKKPAYSPDAINNSASKLTTSPTEEMSTGSMKLKAQKSPLTKLNRPNLTRITDPASESGSTKVQDSAPLSTPQSLPSTATHIAAVKEEDTHHKRTPPGDHEMQLEAQSTEPSVESSESLKKPQDARSSVPRTDQTSTTPHPDAESQNGIVEGVSSGEVPDKTEICHSEASTAAQSDLRSAKIGVQHRSISPVVPVAPISTHMKKTKKKSKGGSITSEPITPTTSSSNPEQSPQQLQPNYEHVAGPPETEAPKQWEDLVLRGSYSTIVSEVLEGSAKNEFLDDQSALLSQEDNSSTASSAKNPKNSNKSKEERNGAESVDWSSEGLESTQQSSTKTAKKTGSYSLGRLLPEHVAIPGGTSNLLNCEPNRSDLHIEAHGQELSVMPAVDLSDNTLKEGDIVELEPPQDPNISVRNAILRGTNGELILIQGHNSNTQAQTIYVNAQGEPSCDCHGMLTNYLTGEETKAKDISSSSEDKSNSVSKSLRVEYQKGEPSHLAQSIAVEDLSANIDDPVPNKMLPSSPKKESRSPSKDQAVGYYDQKSSYVTIAKAVQGPSVGVGVSVQDSYMSPISAAVPARDSKSEGRSTGGEDAIARPDTSNDNPERNQDKLLDARATEERKVEHDLADPHSTKVNTNATYSASDRMDTPPETSEDGDSLFPSLPISYGYITPAPSFETIDWEEFIKDLEYLLENDSEKGAIQTIEAMARRGHGRSLNISFDDASQNLHYFLSTLNKQRAQKRAQNSSGAHDVVGVQISGRYGAPVRSSCQSVGHALFHAYVGGEECYRNEQNKWDSAPDIDNLKRWVDDNITTVIAGVENEMGYMKSLAEGRKAPEARVSPNQTGPLESLDIDQSKRNVKESDMKRENVEAHLKRAKTTALVQSGGRSPRLFGIVGDGGEGPSDEEVSNGNGLGITVDGLQLAAGHDSTPREIPREDGTPSQIMSSKKDEEQSDEDNSFMSALESPIGADSTHARDDKPKSESSNSTHSVSRFQTTSTGPLNVPESAHDKDFPALGKPNDKVTRPETPSPTDVRAQYADVVAGSPSGRQPSPSNPLLNESVQTRPTVEDKKENRPPSSWALPQGGKRWGRPETQSKTETQSKN